MKNRLILCLLLCGLLLYYAAPRLSITAGGAEGIFALLWLLLALFVIAGNLAGALFTQYRTKRGMANTERYKKKRMRSFHV